MNSLNNNTYENEKLTKYDVAEQWKILSLKPIKVSVSKYIVYKIDMCQ